jgi:hypothetical protein
MDTSDSAPRTVGFVDHYFFGTIWLPTLRARLPVSRLVPRKALSPPRHAAGVLSEERALERFAARAGSNFGKRDIGTGLYVLFLPVYRGWVIRPYEH